MLEKIAGYQQSLITTTDREIVEQFFGRGATYYQVGENRVSLLDKSPGESPDAATTGAAQEPTDAPRDDGSTSSP